MKMDVKKIMAGIVLLVFAVSCDFLSNLQPGGEANVRINTGVNRTAPTDVSSFKLTVTAADMVTISQAFTGSTIQMTVPSGSSRTFLLEARDSSGNTLFAGSNTADLVAGETVSLTISLDYKGYYVSFNTDGGSNVPVQFVDNGAFVIRPADPTKSGSSFSAWYKEAALTNLWVFGSDTVTADINLYAKWNLLDSTVPVAGGGGIISFDSFTDSTINLSWTAATDDISAQGALTYDVYSSLSNNIATVADCSANGTKLTASAVSALVSYTATGLTGGSLYYFNVVVSDGAGNQTAYISNSRTTATLLAQTGSYGYYIAGDGSGGGGAGDYSTNYNRTGLGGDGGGDNDILTGSAGNDILFGDGSGGGGGGVPYTVSYGGAGGSGSDTLYGGAGNDILFGDGFAGEDMPGGDSAASSSSAVGGGDPNGGQGGFGGGGGGGGCYYPIDGNGNGGNGGLLAGGGGSQTGAVLGVPLYGGFSGGLDSKPVGGSASDDNRWGGNSAIPYSGTDFFNEQSLGGSGYNAFGAGGGAGFGGANSLSQSIASGVPLSVNGGYPQGGNAAAGSATPVAWYDSDGGLYSYVSGLLSGIYTTAPGTAFGNGSGADILDGGAGSDDLFGMGGNDSFVFELNDAGASDTDTVWDFDLVAETDLLDLRIGGVTISTSERDALIAGQTTSGNDRQIVFTDSVSSTVTIVIKNLGRDLTSADFAVP